jgi:hypothetical protein
MHARQTHSSPQTTHSSLHQNQSFWYKCFALMVDQAKVGAHPLQPLNTIPAHTSHNHRRKPPRLRTTPLHPQPSRPSTT